MPAGAVALFATRKRFEESVTSYRRALEIVPGFVQAFGGMMYTKTYICDWRDRAVELATLEQHVGRWLRSRAGEAPPVLLPLQALVYTTLSTPKVLKAITAKHARDLRLQQVGTLGSGDESSGVVGEAVAPQRSAGRLRLCYASLGFESHPHGQLMRGVFALHNRSLVEVVAFALSPDDGSEERRDIASTADHFVALDGHPSPGAAMRRWGCDIALYLDGYVMRARPQLFARNSDGSGGVAPVQIACMYPATLGTDDFDYHLGDHVCTPPELHDGQFTEALLPLPYSYYVNDYARSYTTLPSRHSPAVAASLPAPGRFRFVNFNQLFKTDGERTLWAWSNLLRRNPASILWQLANPPAGVDNLQAELHSRGVPSARLHWSVRRPSASTHQACRCRFSLSVHLRLVVVGVSM